MHATRMLATTLAAAVLATACATTGDDATTTTTPDDTTTTSSAPPDTTTTEPVELTLVTHDSFNLSEDVLAAFTEDTGIEVEVLRGGDAGSVLNQAVLTAGDPLGDVIFGIDNVSLSVALDAGILSPLPDADLPADLDPAFDLDPEHRAIPIDHGDVCLNYDREAFTDLALPDSIEALRDETYASRLVVENPATSSPGLAFMLATIAAIGEDGWLDWWQDLRDGGVEVTSGWEEAYYGAFSGGANEGDNPLVVSYASSPPAEVLFGPDPEADEAPTGTILSTCYRQIEFAGVLAGTEHPDEAAMFVEFLLSDLVQQDIPLTMFVFPVRDVALPDVFAKHAEIPSDPWALDPATVAEHREEWIEAWTDVMLR